MPPLRIRPTTNNDYYVYTKPSQMLKDLEYNNPYNPSIEVQREVEKRLPNTIKYSYPDRTPLHQDFRPWESQRLGKFYTSDGQKDYEEIQEGLKASARGTPFSPRFEQERFYTGEPLTRHETKRLNELFIYTPNELLNQYLNRYEKYIESGYNPDTYNFNIPELLKDYGTQQAQQYGRDYANAHFRQTKHETINRQREELKDKLYAQLSNAPLASRQSNLSNPYVTILNKYMRAEKGNRDVKLSDENLTNRNLLESILRRYSVPISQKDVRKKDKRDDTNVYANNLNTRYEGGFRRRDFTRPTIETRYENPFRDYIRRQNGV
jgi:hypothetical protein